MVDIDACDELQAVLIADSFSCTFWPITYDLPKALMPLANIPLIEYALEFLSRNKVKELIIFCTVHPQMVEKYMSRVRVKGCKVRCFEDSSCKSLGDVLRWLDREQVLKGDFILVGSDFVSNADLSTCLSQHKARRKSDSEFILTKVFKSVPFTSRLRTSIDQIAVTLHKDEIVQIEDLGEATELHCASDFSKLPECETRFDLVDTNLSICTPELLNRFTDNFDFQTLEQVMKELLTNDVYTDKVGAYVLPPHFYLSRAQDPRTYDAVTKDVLSRWTYPIVLNSNLLPRSTPTTYTCQLSNLYREEGVKVFYTASVTPPTAIGTRTVISDQAIVTKSVIGRDCKIGVGAVVEESYIWDSVVIEDGAKISHSIICSGCIIGAESNIQRGSILATGTVLREGTILGPNTRLSRETTKEISSETKIGNAFVHWGEGLCLDDEKQKLTEEQSIGGTLQMWTEEDNWDTGSSDSEIDTDIKYDEFGNQITLQGHPECTCYIAFTEEVKVMMLEAIGNDEDTDTLYLNINNLKFAQNKGFTECIAGIVKGLFAQVPADLEELLDTWKDLLLRFAMGTEGHLHLIREIEKAVAPLNMRRRFHKILLGLQQRDIVEAKDIISWFSESQDEELNVLVPSK